MKWIHLADLHIGKQHEVADLETDQRKVLTEIVGIVQAEKPDGVLIAGDVYDRSLPAERAVQMLNDFLLKLCDLCPVYLISGNHDSGSRLSFAASLLAREGLHISGTYNGELRPIHQGDTDIYLMPFLHPVEVRRVLQDSSITSMTDTIRAVLSTCVPGNGRRRILVAHQFVTDGNHELEKSDSEKQVGTVDNIDYTLFQGFDYVALGHIHGAQPVGRETVRYCGTPMMYSFSEEHHVKSVTVYDSEAEVPIRTIPLTSARRMRKVRGLLNELLQPDFDPLDHHDIVLAELTDREPQVNAKERLLSVYETVTTAYVNIHSGDNIGQANLEHISLEDPLKLFEIFYSERNGVEMNEHQREVVEKLLRSTKEECICS